MERKRENLLILSLFLFTIFLSSIEACLSDVACSGHGSCVKRVCQCDPGWTGDDCSIELVDVNSGDVITAQLSDRQWIFYDISTLDTDLSLTFSVSQNNILSDCDLYVQMDSFPSKSDYFQKDSSRDQNFTIQISSPGDHEWYAGMYGFFDCAFTMTVNIETKPTCPNQCSNHGVCQLNSTCSCNLGFTGNDCSTAIIQLIDGVPISNHISQFTWEYFYYSSVAISGTVPEFTIIVNQTNQGEGDSDLYIAYDRLPTLFSYDYRDATLVENYALTVGSPLEGVYYIGIYGYRACSYTIKLEVEEDTNCEDLCSRHGNCYNNACRCSGPFTGTKCENMTEALQDGNSVNGYVENNSRNYYFANTQTSNNMVINLRQVSSGGDCDVYVKADSTPTKTSYDLRDIGFSQNFNITILNPLGNTWYIGVFGYRSCDYIITEYISKTTCPNNCSGNGNCSNGGRCSCNSGFAGDDCASPLYRIHSGELLSSSVKQNNWVYYKYTAPSTKSSITIELLETDSTGYLWLYLEHGVPPSQSQFLASDTSEKAAHVIHLLIDNENSDSDYYIGVYGSPYLPLTINGSFQIVAYSPSI